MEKTVVETHDEKYEAEASGKLPLDEEDDSPIEEVRVTVSSKHPHIHCQADLHKRSTVLIADMFAQP